MQNARTQHALKHIAQEYLSELQDLTMEGKTVKFQLSPHDAAMMFSQLQLLNRARENWPLTAGVVDKICAEIEAQMGHKPAVALMFALTKNPAFDETVKTNG